MRFTADGPSIPDELLLARDRGEVVFFCGAGVSQARAGLSNFSQLAKKVLGHLGAGEGSPARKLLDVASNLDPIEGVGSFVATDRVFSLLEREFDTDDIHAAVALALKPKPVTDLSAHRIVLDLAGARTGAVRLVTTNFDLLFEGCDPAVRSIGPVNLPDARRADLKGVIHLHGRVDPEYEGSDEEGFVLSSGDFGKAYLADGWAARFIQSLLTRFRIVFLGYSADDPPVQYLLEALKGGADAGGRMYAFQSGESAVASSLWESKGVHAMAYADANKHEALWSTLEAWAARANDVDGWYDGILRRAAVGPEALKAHERGQMAHVFSSVEGVRRLLHPGGGIPASWIRVVDPKERYGEAQVDPSKGRNDPFDHYGLDSDTPPSPKPSEDQLAYLARPREVPSTSWNGFDLYPQDNVIQGRRPGALYGPSASTPEALPSRLQALGSWLVKVAHEPAAFEWALKQKDLHPTVKHHLSSVLEHDASRFPSEIARGWRYLLRTWEEPRGDADRNRFAISAEAKLVGWSDHLVRQLMSTRRVRLHVEDYSRPSVKPDDDRAFSLKIEYPRPHVDVDVPEEFLRVAAACCRENLDYARSLEAEVHGSDWIYLPTTYETTIGSTLDLNTQYGLAGPVLEMQRLMGRLAAYDAAAARAELLRWPADDDGIFARLRIWAAGRPEITSVEEAGAIFVALSDKAFWGSLHQRDLLMNLRNRWNELPASYRREIERKLTETNYPWERSGQSEEFSARSLLERLRWFLAEGFEFDFDAEAIVASFSSRFEDSLPPVDVAVEDSQPRVFSIDTNTDPSPLLSLAVREILRAPVAAPDIDYRARIHHDPFSGLVETHPVRAFSALAYEARSGNIHAEAWSVFLRSGRREEDKTRMMVLIVDRLRNLSAPQLSEILYAVADWMKRLAPRLQSQASNQFEALWQKTVEAAPLSPQSGERNPERNWADDGLNSPVGRLTQILLDDPSLRGGPGIARLGLEWRRKMEAILALPGDLRRQALVLASFQFSFLCYLDRRWAIANIMPSMDDDGPDGDGFWDGFLWANKVPCPPLLSRMRPSIVRRISSSPHRKPDGLADILLYAWVEWSGRRRPPLTNAQFRQAIVEGGAEFGIQVLSNLGRRHERTPISRDVRAVFLRDVWPRQKALKSEETTRALISFAFRSGDIFPEVAGLIMKRLTPCRSFDLYPLQTEDAGGIVDQHPMDLLEVLLRVLAEDVYHWPYQTAAILDRLVRDPRTAADTRLSRLRRLLGLRSVAPA
ncbi:hypothetical protein HFN76_18460 [Rhizobium laguerreae]|uniref:SIR2 family protein n=1 Tax=Rhizobium laguerreae TaxID=1076926 RepID=UPI001C9073B5|nr:SIR2 family protein [Rhizobium laguerreae]MBY3514196.1 hypothetical protein [Rhizobium laguerreae]